MAGNVKMAPEAAFQSGLDAYHNGDYKSAAKSFAVAAKQKPDDARYHFYRGASYLNLGKAFEGSTSLDKAIDCDPSNAEAYYLRGKCFMLGLDDKRAASDFSEAVARNQNESKYRYERAVAHKEGKRYIDALVDFENYFSLTAEPTAESLCHYGWCLASLGNSDRALEFYERALKIDRKCATAQLYIASLQFEFSNFDDALGSLKLAQQIYDDEINKEKSKEVAFWTDTLETRSATNKRLSAFAGMPSHKQLEILANCGIELALEVPLDAIYEWRGDSEQQFASDPFSKLLSVLAFGNWKGMHLCNQIWGFNPESIYKDGDYVFIAIALMSICHDQLPLQDIVDSVDLFDEPDESSKGRAQLQFDLDGKTHKIKLKVHDDWVDNAIFAKLGKLLSKRTNGASHLYRIGFGSSDFAAVCLSEKQSQLLRETTFIEIDRF